MKYNIRLNENQWDLIRELLEKRRNPSINTNDNIERKKIQKILATVNEKWFISFRTQQYTTSINPKTEYETPNGLYTYPLRAYWSDFRNVLKNKTDNLDFEGELNTIFPFVPEGSKYINFYRLKNNKGIYDTENINADKLGMQVYNIAKDKFSKDLPSEVKKIFAKQSGIDALEEVNELHWINDIRSKLSLVYNFINYISDGGNDFRKKLTQVGINGIIDKGTGTIHENEPYQAVFFFPKTSLEMKFSLEIEGENTVKFDKRGNAVGFSKEKKDLYSNLARVKQGFQFLSLYDYMLSPQEYSNALKKVPLDKLSQKMTVSFGKNGLEGFLKTYKAFPIFFIKLVGEFKTINPEMLNFVGERLMVKNCGLTKLPTEIGNQKNLVELYVSDNKLKDLPTSIANIKSLKRIDLNDNEFTEIPKVLYKMPNLSYLDLKGNKIPKEDIENLRNHYKKMGKRIQIDF